MIRGTHHELVTVLGYYPGSMKRNTSWFRRLKLFTFRPVLLNSKAITLITLLPMHWPYVRPAVSHVRPISSLVIVLIPCSIQILFITLYTITSPGIM